MASLDGILQHIIVTLTNGVSFSLVAGATCLISFSNKLANTGSSSGTTVTINVNSTGAKTMRHKNISWRGYVEDMIAATNGGPISNDLLVVYKNDAYYIPNDVPWAAYSYGDS